MAAELFGRGIAVFAGEFVADNGLRAGVGILGDAEVDDDGLGGHATAQDDVVGRQVAVDDPAVMGNLEPVGHPAANRDQIGGGHAALLHPGIKGGPLDVIHHQIDQAAGGAVVLGIAHDGVVPDLADFFFAAHQGQISLIAGKLGFQRLDRHETARDFVAGLVNLRRATATEDVLDPVGVVQKVAGLKAVALP